MVKTTIRFLTIALALYIIFCGAFYFFQERFLFYPDKLGKDYKFHFKENFKGLLYTNR